MKTGRIYIWVIALTLIILMASGCGGCGKKAEKSTSDLSSREIRVVTTTGMITDIVKIVGGERVNVTGLMDTGVAPHLYKTDSEDMPLLSEADLIFYNGLHLEARMDEVLEQMEGRVKTVAVTNGIARDVLLFPPEFEGALDPHVWFDVTLWMKAVEFVRDTLIDIDSSSAEFYRVNAKSYLEELAELHEYVQSQAERVPTEQRVLITAHDAFNYFGRAYGFEVHSLQRVSTETETGTTGVQELVEFIAKRKIPAIFVDSSEPRRNIEAVQAAVRARGASVDIGEELFSDAMGEQGTPEDSYIGMVRHNIDSIVSALLGE